MNTQIFLFALAQIIAVIGSGIVAYVKIVERFGVVNERFIKIEMLIALKILHSPHRPISDAILEKYHLNFDLPMNEWEILKDQMLLIISETNSTLVERSQSRMIHDLCVHKLQRKFNFFRK